jgi:methyltransferase family protein
MVKRSEVVQAFLDLYPDPDYLEIGVSLGTTLHAVKARRKVGVDPGFKFDVKAVGPEHPDTEYRVCTSDAYFGAAPRDEMFDVVYLDGLHTLEQTLRDLLNALEHLKPHGVIVIDDVYPISYAASMPDLVASKRLRRALGVEKAAWMGDVYRLVFFIQTFCQSLSYAGVAENHGQLVVWRGARPEDAIPHRRVEEVGRMPYETAVLDGSVFGFTALSEIVEAVRATIEGRPPPALSTARSAPGKRGGALPGRHPAAGMTRDERLARRKALKGAGKAPRPRPASPAP